MDNFDEFVPKVHFELIPIKTLFLIKNIKECFRNHI